MKSDFFKTVFATFIGGVISLVTNVFITYHIPKWQQEDDAKKWLQTFAVEIKDFDGTDIICERIFDVKRKIKNTNSEDILGNQLMIPDSVLLTPSVYRSNLDKIGLLKSDEAELIINFHAAYYNSLIMLSESSVYNKQGFNKKYLTSLLSLLMDAEKYKQALLKKVDITYSPKCNLDQLKY